MQAYLNKSQVDTDVIVSSHFSSVAVLNPVDTCAASDMQSRRGSSAQMCQNNKGQRVNRCNSARMYPLMQQHAGFSEH